MDLESSITRALLLQDHYNLVRRQIEQRFLTIDAILKEAKEKLLASIDAIVLTFSGKTQYYEDQFAALNEYKRKTEDILQINNVSEFRSEQMKEIDGLLKDIQERSAKKVGNIQLKWNENVIKEAIDNFCQVNYTETQSNGTCPIRDYTQDHEPIKCFSSQGIHDEELMNPAGIAIDSNTNNIFVADSTENCVKVFSQDGEYLYHFGNKDGVIMFGPHGLCIDGDLLYLTQKRSSSVRVYRLDGTFLKKVGKFGTNNDAFRFPTGLCINPDNGDLYVCDSGNNRVIVFTKNLVYKRTFGNGILKRPKDIKIDHNGEIIVLDSNNFCFHFFDKKGKHLGQIIQNDDDPMKLFGLKEPQFFDLDFQGNAIISDAGNHCLSVFTMNGEYLKVIGGYGKEKGEFVHPQGVAVSKDGHIVSVCTREKNQIQIF